MSADEKSPATTPSDPAVKTITEGTTTMAYPADQEEAVFYNPVQVQNRDLSILMIVLYGERRTKRMAVNQYKKTVRQDQNLSGEELKEAIEQHERKLDATQLVRDQDASTAGLAILDALAASGLRSIRYWKEIPGVKHVTINDLDPVAVERAHQNLAVNGLKSAITQGRGHGVRVQCGGATHEMYLSRRPPSLKHFSPSQELQRDQWDVIDLDPYGSAAPFLDAAVQAIRDGGMLCVTCTDMAALGGSHPETAFGRYASMPIPRAKYLQEVALRILLYTLSTTAARYGRTIRPILSVGMAFYIRVFVEVNNDKAGVHALSLNVGSVYQSKQCPSFHIVPLGQTSPKNANVYQPGKTPGLLRCEETGAGFKIGGPIWLGPLHDVDVVETALERLESSKPVVPDMKYIATQERVHGLMTSVSEELPDVPLYYTLPDLSHTLRCETPQLDHAKAALVNAGYRVSGYHKEPQAIKTDAPNRVVWDVMRAWCKEHPPQETSKKKARKQKKNGGEQAEQEDASKKILSVEPTTHVDFNIPNSFKERRRAKRFPFNPEKNWGPKARASGQKRKAEEE